MGARRHRNKKSEQPAGGGVQVAQSRRNDGETGAPRLQSDAPRDHALDAIFDPAHVRLGSVMQRQSELATLAWHFALSSIFVPVAGIVLGLLAVLFAREAQDMFDLVGGVGVDRSRAHKALIIGGTMTGVWLIATVVLMIILVPRGF